MSKRACQNLPLKGKHCPMRMAIPKVSCAIIIGASDGVLKSVTLHIQNESSEKAPKYKSNVTTFSYLYPATFLILYIITGVKNDNKRNTQNTPSHPRCIFSMTFNTSKKIPFLKMNGIETT